MNKKILESVQFEKLWFAIMYARELKSKAQKEVKDKATKKFLLNQVYSSYFLHNCWIKNSFSKLVKQ